MYMGSDKDGLVKGRGMMRPHCMDVTDSCVVDIVLPPRAHSCVRTTNKYENNVPT